MPKNGTNGVSNTEERHKAVRFIGNNIVKLNNMNNHKLFILYFLSSTIEITEYIQIIILLTKLAIVWFTIVSIGVKTIKNAINSNYY